MFSLLLSKVKTYQYYVLPETKDNIKNKKKKKIIKKKKRYSLRPSRRASNSCMRTCTTATPVALFVEYVHFNGDAGVTVCSFNKSTFSLHGLGKSLLHLY